MKLKVIDKLSKRFTKTASVEMKKEIRKTAIDLIPGIVAVAGMILSVVVFRNTDEDSSRGPLKTTTHTTVNNYFFNEISEETILKILEDADE